MVRQCAWCLRLMNGTGERVSLLPQPKLYEASHGMCSICGTQWMEQVLQEIASQERTRWTEDDISDEAESLSELTT